MSRNLTPEEVAASHAKHIDMIANPDKYCFICADEVLPGDAVTYKGKNVGLHLACESKICAVITPDTRGAEHLLVLKAGEPLGGVLRIDLRDRSYHRFCFERLDSFETSPGAGDGDFSLDASEWSVEKRPDLYEDGTYDALQVGSLRLQPPQCQDVPHVRLCLNAAFKATQPKETTT